MRLARHLLDPGDDEEAGREGKRRELRGFALVAQQKKPTVAPRRVAATKEADKASRFERLTPLSRNLEIVANPSGRSAVTCPTASTRARANATVDPTPIMSPSLNRSMNTAA